MHGWRAGLTCCRPCAARPQGRQKKVRCKGQGRGKHLFGAGKPWNAIRAVTVQSQWRHHKAPRRPAGATRRRQAPPHGESKVAILLLSATLIAPPIVWRLRSAEGSSRLARVQPGVQTIFNRYTRYPTLVRGRKSLWKCADCLRCPSVLCRPPDAAQQRKHEPSKGEPLDPCNLQVHMASPELLEWCRRGGVQWAGIEAGFVAEGWRGVLATEDIPAGTCILRVPRRLLMSVESARRDPQLAAALAAVEPASSSSPLTSEQVNVTWPCAEACEDVGQRSAALSKFKAQ